MAEPHLILQREGHVATVTMNRPEARNAFGPEMLVRLADAWAQVDADPEVRAVILTGAGGHFCAGSDLKAMATRLGPGRVGRSASRKTRISTGGPCCGTTGVKKPLIAAVEGTAVAGGTEILQGTDIRIAGASAKLGVAEAQVGPLPAGRVDGAAAPADPLHAGDGPPAHRAGTSRPRRRCASASSAAWCPTGRRSPRRGRWPSRSPPTGRSRCRPSSAPCIETEGLPEEEALAKELEIGWPILATEDAKEGPRAFIEKRKPDFKGK